YTYTVTNAGEAPLSSVTVTDSLGMTATYQSGDDGDNILEVGETWIFTATWTVAATPDPLLNTGTASGSDGTNTYTDTDDHSLDVLTSAINIVKTGPASAVVGETVTYTYTVTNAGEAPLSSVTVTDSLGMTATYQSGDDGDNILEVGETWIFTATWTVAATPDPLLNTGTAKSGGGHVSSPVTGEHSLPALTSTNNIVKTGPAS